MYRFFIYFILLVCIFGCKPQKDEVREGETTRYVKSSVESKESKSDMLQKPIHEVMGHFSPQEHTDYVIIDPKYADREGLFLHKEAFLAFEKMWTAAKQDGIDLIIRSATRNFDYQKGIWERKWSKIKNQSIAKGVPQNDVNTAKEILEYSSMPGTSRHHWGTDIDLNSFDNSYFDTGEGVKVYNWLNQNANRFGFCQPYTTKGEQRPYGYNEEKWHWSYLPVAISFYKTAENELKNEMIKGFSGDHTTEQINVVQHYILGINPACK